MITPTTIAGRRGSDLPSWRTGGMTAAAITRPEQIEVIEIPIPEPEPGEVLVQISYVGICGTDLELLHGTASYLRDGRTRFPHVFGHEWSGTVIATCQTEITTGLKVVGNTMISCTRCRRCQQGQRNLCTNLRETGLYGQQGAAATYLRVPEHAVTPVPLQVSDMTAALVEPAVTVLEGISAAGVRHGDHVVVLGTGTIGLLAVQALKGLGAAVDVVGIEPAGRELALRMGAREAHQPESAPARHYSVAVEASGSATAFRQALDLLAPGGRLSAIGVPDRVVDGIDAARLVLDGLQVRGVRHGLDHYWEALQLFKSGVFDAGSLIDIVFPIDRAADAFNRMVRTNRRAPKVMLEVAAGVAAQ